MGTPADGSDDVVVEAGSPYRIHVAGEGIVVQNTGRMTFFPDGTFEFHGPHQQLDVVGDELICAQLG